MNPGKVLAAYLHPGTVTAGFMESFCDLLLWDAKHNENISNGGGILRFRSSANVTASRNKVVERFLDESQAEWLWCVDTDHTFSPDLLDLLLQAADPEERPIVGALCFIENSDRANSVTYWPTMYFWDGEHMLRPRFYRKNEITEVTATGAGCLLIHRSVLEAMRERFGGSVFPWFEETELEGRRIGEDIGFCLKARTCGFDIFVHTGAPTGHIKQYVIDERTFEVSQSMTYAPKACVTGTGRSGTRYIAELLQRVGVNAGHESWWNPKWPMANHLDVDVSWLALPFIEEGRWNGPVFLQVRDPLKVVSSLLNGELGPHNADNEWWQFKKSYTPGWEDDWEKDAVRFVYSWLTRILALGPERVWRVEALTADDVRAVAAAVGKEVNDTKLEAAISQTSKRANKHATGPAVTWDSLPPIPETEKLRVLAEELGYEY